MPIRRCNLADRAELLAVHTLQRAAYEIEAALIGTREIPGLAQTLSQLASSPEEFYGAFDDTTLAGLIAVEDELNAAADAAASPPLRISRLAVNPVFFRRGIGRTLVRHIVSAFGRQQARTLLVSTGAANTPGRALYESEGFRRVAEREAGRLQRVRIVEYKWG